MKINNNITGIIVAGGLGTRLRPLTYEMPKALITVNGIPLLNYTVRWLLSYGIKRIYVLISEKWVQSFIQWKDRFISDIKEKPEITLFEEEKELGTFGYIFKLYKKNIISTDYLFVCNADEIKYGNIAKMYRSLSDLKKNKNVCVLLGLAIINNPEQYGMVHIQKNGRILEFVYHPDKLPEWYSRFNTPIMAGCYLTSKDIFNYVPNKENISVEQDVFTRIAKDGRLYGFYLKEYWDCGTFEKWEQTILHFKAQ